MLQWTKSELRPLGSNKVYTISVLIPHVGTCIEWAMSYVNYRSVAKKAVFTCTGDACVCKDAGDSRQCAIRRTSSTPFNYGLVIDITAVRTS